MKDVYGGVWLWVEMEHMYDWPHAGYRGRRGVKGGGERRRERREGGEV